ncbi:hypothetical protein NDU88_001513 [Pleurodeles waltl]|uniref:Uncharacterized protein n=1 Tax=Pleurodeles waltl TaxID=8319 RepID=A0AAV7THW6_PLEWA|nr:hypothetical protein NDU88_001513 [Pleurodeles waltl]
MAATVAQLVQGGLRWWRPPPCRTVSLCRETGGYTCWGSRCAGKALEDGARPGRCGDGERGLLFDCADRLQGSLPGAVWEGGLILPHY